MLEISFGYKQMTATSGTLKDHGVAAATSQSTNGEPTFTANCSEASINVGKHAAGGDSMSIVKKGLLPELDPSFCQRPHQAKQSLQTRRERLADGGAAILPNERPVAIMIRSHDRMRDRGDTRFVATARNFADCLNRAHYQNLEEFAARACLRKVK